MTQPIRIFALLPLLALFVWAQSACACLPGMAACATTMSPMAQGHMDHGKGSTHQTPGGHKDCPACHAKTALPADQTMAKAPALPAMPVMLSAMVSRVDANLRQTARKAHAPPPVRRLPVSSPVSLHIRLIR